MLDMLAAYQQFHEPSAGATANLLHARTQVRSGAEAFGVHDREAADPLWMPGQVIQHFLFEIGR